jgi:hypothetical protein
MLVKNGVGYLWYIQGIFRERTIPRGRDYKPENSRESH